MSAECSVDTSVMAGLQMPGLEGLDQKNPKNINETSRVSPSNIIDSTSCRRPNPNETLGRPYWQQWLVQRSYLCQKDRFHALREAHGT